MNKITTGPWKWHGWERAVEPGRQNCLMSEDGRVVLTWTLEGGSDRAKIEVSEADAKLIAQAPRMLAALKDVELRMMQARLASTIGRQTLKTADFLRGELERMGDAARAILKEVGE